jgi:hypothetical protein
MAIQVTESELIAAIQQAQFACAEEDETAFTTTEVAKLLDVGYRQGRETLGATSKR